MTLQVEHPKWILYRHTSDFTLLCEVAQILKSYSKTNITKAEKEVCIMNGIHNYRLMLLITR